MPRNYKRSTNKAAWSVNELNQAIDQLKSGRMSLRQASRSYGIPKTTLQKRSKSNIISNPNMGRKTIFTAEQENDLVDHIITLSKLFHGISVIELRRMVYEYADANTVSHNFDASTKLAGMDWFYEFRKRHPNISLRKPEATSMARVQGFNRLAVNRFYTNLNSVNETLKLLPSRIFNVDESGFTTVQVPQKILAQTGQHQIGKITSAERGQNVTVICAMSASGAFIPPQFIFPRVNMSHLLMKDAPPQSVGSVSKSGWVNEELFVKWLKHFSVHANCSAQNPCLLILDNHISHVSLAAYNFCKSKGITMLSLPPHTSHRLQPLDVSFFGPLKKAYNRECDLFMKQNIGRRITQYEIAGLFHKAYSKVASLEKAESGFRAAGIIPFNPDIWSDEDFLAAECLQSTEKVELIN